MIIRQALNFTAHLVAGVAVGALAMIAIQAVKRREDVDWQASENLDHGEEPSEPT